jgi:hypothetical protein
MSDAVNHWPAMVVASECRSRVYHALRYLYMQRPDMSKCVTLTTVLLCNYERVLKDGVENSRRLLVQLHSFACQLACVFEPDARLDYSFGPDPQGKGIRASVTDIDMCQSARRSACAAACTVMMSRCLRHAMPWAEIRLLVARILWTSRKDSVWDVPSPHQQQRGRKRVKV